VTKKSGGPSVCYNFWTKGSLFLDILTTFGQAMRQQARGVFWLAWVSPLSQWIQSRNSHACCDARWDHSALDRGQSYGVEANTTGCFVICQSWHYVTQCKLEQKPVGVAQRALFEENHILVSSELMKLQLAWLDQGLDEFESQIRLQSYLEAGFDPELAAAAVSAELHIDTLKELHGRVEQLERMVALLRERFENETND
jgi:hypothetical protein